MATQDVVVGASWAAPGGAVVTALAGQSAAVGLGVTGQRLSGWIQRAVEGIAGHQGRVFVLEMGGNGVPAVAEVREAHRRLVGSVGDGGSVVWVLAPRWPRDTPERARVAGMRDATAANVRAAGVPLVGGNRATMRPGDLRDYAHLNAPGARRFVASWRKSGSKTGLVFATALAAFAGWKAAQS